MENTVKFAKKNVCEVTEEEAAGMTEDFLKKAGIMDISTSAVRVLKWYYFTESTGKTVATEYDGYVIRFDRVVNGTPVYQDFIGGVDNLIDKSIDNPADNKVCIVILQRQVWHYKNLIYFLFTLFYNGLATNEERESYG